MEGTKGIQCLNPSPSCSGGEGVRGVIQKLGVLS